MLTKYVHNFVIQLGKVDEQHKLEVKKLGLALTSQLKNKKGCPSAKLTVAVLCIFFNVLITFVSVFFLWDVFFSLLNFNKI